MKRRPVDSWFWELYVQACGGRCGACSAAGVKLERGHIVPHAFGGTDGLENLLPLCLRCNKKYLKKETPDKRPADWRERFFLLIGHVLQPQISVSQEKGLCSLIPTTKQTENSMVIDWQNTEFSVSTEVFTQSCDDVYQQAKAAVREMVTRSRELEPKPFRPTAKRQEQMKDLAITRGVKAFRIAGEEFLREMPWVLDERRGSAHHDSFLHFCESFDFYVEDGTKRAKRLAEQGKLQRERDRVQQEAATIAQRESRLAKYLRAAKVPTDWPGIPDGDPEVIAAAVAAAKDASIKDVDESLLEQSIGVQRRYKIYRTDALLAEKNKIRHLMTKCARIAAEQYNDVENQKAVAAQIKNVLDWVDGSPDIAYLRRVDGAVADLCASLGLLPDGTPYPDSVLDPESGDIPF